METSEHRGLITACIGAIVVVLAGTAAAQTTWYVDKDATPPGDGTSWFTAFTRVEPALTAAVPGDEVRVAEGTYTPPLPTSPFALMEGVSLRGSYAGRGHPDPNARDTDYHRTVLSGDILGDDQPGFVNRTENCDHVVVVVDVPTYDEVAILDGLTIRGGHADGPLEMDGGGVWATEVDLRLERCTLVDNDAFDEGGGLYAENADVMVLRCTLDGNTAGDGGGAFVRDAELTLVGSDILANQATWGVDGRARGGGIGLGGDSRVRARNSLFQDNVAMADHAHGGAIQAWPLLGDPLFVELTDCRFVGNEAIGLNGASGGGAVQGGAMRIRRCLFEGNRTEGTGWNSAGGAVSCNSELLVGQTRFVGNEARTSANDALGGAVAVAERLGAVDCVFSGNGVQGVSTYSLGGAVYVNAIGMSYVRQCSFSGNWVGGDSGEIGGLTIVAYGEGSGARVRNSVFWGNHDSLADLEKAQLGDMGWPSLDVQYCDVQGWTGALGGSGNFGLDPLFVDADGPDDVMGTADDVLRLRLASPCIDTGNDDLAYPDYIDLDGDRITDEPIPWDIDGLERFIDLVSVPNGAGGVVDMGAHETVACAPGPVDTSPTNPQPASGQTLGGSGTAGPALRNRTGMAVPYVPCDDG